MKTYAHNYIYIHIIFNFICEVHVLYLVSMIHYDTDVSKWFTIMYMYVCVQYLLH